MSTFKLPRKHKLEGFRRKKVNKPHTKSNTRRVRKPNYSDLRIEKEYSYINENEYKIDEVVYDLSESERLALAINKNNIKVTRSLLSKGVTYSCDDCYECGWPETCSLKTCMTNNRVGIITILFEISSSDAIISSFQSTIGMEKNNQPFNVMISMFKKIESSLKNKKDSEKYFVNGKLVIIPPFVTEKNKDFIYFLMENGHTNMEKILQNNVEWLFCMNIYKKWKIVDTIIKVISLGVDTSFKMKMGSIYCKNWCDIPGVKYIEDELYVEISMDDIIENRNILKSCFNGVIHSLGQIAEDTKYNKYNNRLKFISKRIRGFDQSNDPDEFVKRFIGMEISLFAKVLSYLI